jgi:hypothetical protein
LIQKRAAVASVALFLSLALYIASCGDESGPQNGHSTISPTPTGASTPTESPAAPVDDPPIRDLLDLARRFRGYPYDGPAVARTTPFDYKPGDQADFTLIDLDNTRPYTITATVQRVTDHAYFFVQNGSPYTESGLDRITSDFETSVWPQITGAFGEPETPGVDGDPRITILHADLRGAGGYVSASDSYPSAAVPRSAEREILYIEDDVLSSPGSAYNALVAHELQHLVHEARDINEEAWVNEGMSQVAWEIVGGRSDGVWEFLGKPDTQLNFWPYQQDVSIHYSASELFLSYLLDQYGGRQNARVLASESGDGIDGVEAYLKGFNRTFDDVFADFVAANVLDLPTGPYSHPGFDGTTTAQKDIASSDSGDDTVSQYGTDYYRVESGGFFSFDGADTVTIGIPEIDGPFWWSNRSDGIDSRLTREVDLTTASSATLTFDLWHDIEPGWDYGYVAVSTDDGRTWEALAGDQTTTDDPIGAAYGPGYTGNSDGWVKERIDLTAYAGEKVLVRFEYVTDDATHLTGMAVDNIAVPEIGLAEAADSANEWIAEGFRRIDGPMKQGFIVQVIGTDNDRVVRANLDAGNVGGLLLGPGSIVAISAVTPGTTEPASYTWSHQ